MLRKATETMGELSRQQRFKLAGILNSLPLAQFNQVVFALNPPAGIIALDGAPQGKRTFELLEWLESPTGLGLKALLEILEEIPNLDTDELLKATSPRYRVTLAVDANSVDMQRLRRIVDGLGALMGDDSIRIIDIDEGSLKIEFTGDPRKLHRLIELFESEEFTEIDGASVIDVKRIGDHVAILKQGSEVWNQWLLTNSFSPGI